MGNSLRPGNGFRNGNAMKTRPPGIHIPGSPFPPSSPKGLTLIEILCATMILAISVVIVLALNRTSIVNYCPGPASERAWRLAHECLDRLSARGVQVLLSQQKLEGDFEPRFPNYRYRLTCAPAASANLYKVTVQILWRENQADRSVEMATYLYDWEQKQAPSTSAPLPAPSENPSGQ